MSLTTKHIAFAAGINIQGDLGPLTYVRSRTKGKFFYMKSPPKTPPTKRQVHMRNRWRLIARLWRQLRPEQRDAWNLAVKLDRIPGSGYNLFVWYHCRHEELAIRRIEARHDITLLPLEIHVVP